MAIPYKLPAHYQVVPSEAIEESHPNYTIYSEHPKAYEITSELFHAYIDDPVITQYFRLDQPTDFGEEQERFSQEYFGENIAPLLVKKTFTIIDTDQLKEETIKYISIILGQEYEHSDFEEAREALLSLSQNLQEKVCVARQVIHTIIPVVVKHQLHVTYGIAKAKNGKSEGDMFAIPYDGKSPNPKPIGAVRFYNIYQEFLLTFLGQKRESVAE
jgi:hypothetical protein